jgi:hypothetical protein
MASDISIASNALILIGDEPISSFAEPGAGATAATNLYQGTYGRVLAMHPWTFALKEIVLSRLSQEPDKAVNFRYAYRLPADHIRTWAMFPLNTEYVVVGDLVYSNENRLYLRYVFQVEESELPPHFIKALEYALATDFAQLITENTSKSDFYESKFKSQVAAAMTIDSQGHPQQPIISSPFTEVRAGGYSGSWGGF